MGKRIFKLPDLGEGTVEAEIVAWHAEVGDVVHEDQTIVEVMTDKASVEVPAPVSGTILSRTGDPGDVLAVGAELVVFATDGDDSEETRPPATAGAAAETTVKQEAAKSPPPTTKHNATVTPFPSPSSNAKPLASPAVRRLAKDSGIDLSVISGSGPKGRIRKSDVEALLSGGMGATRIRRSGVKEVKIIGLRRKIAERMSAANQSIPQFGYVEEIDVTELESLRSHLNHENSGEAPRLTYLPFIMLALAKALRSFPQCNAHYDEARNVLLQHEGVHMGIATQTDDGLKVPVVPHVEAMSLHTAAAAASAAAQGAREGTATRDQLSGSTITITSLGKLGGIVTTPVINMPEVSIIGVNKAVERPVVANGAITVRRVMNLSSTFDHRFVDGYDGAELIQSVKSMLEHPAMIFMD